jgi:hypothetical protein
VWIEDQADGQLREEKGDTEAQRRKDLDNRDLLIRIDTLRVRYFGGVLGCLA